MEDLSEDEATEKRLDLSWARILVRFQTEMPAKINVGIGGRVYEVPIWAETTAFCRPWRRYTAERVVGEKRRLRRRRGQPDLFAERYGARW